MNQKCRGILQNHRIEISSPSESPPTVRRDPPRRVGDPGPLNTSTKGGRGGPETRTTRVVGPVTRVDTRTGSSSDVTVPGVLEELKG